MTIKDIIFNSCVRPFFVLPLNPSLSLLISHLSQQRHELISMIQQMAGRMEEAKGSAFLQKG
jgi:hypothetical protein